MNGLKELFTYLTNQLKFWFIVKEWELGLQLRNGRIIRELKEGIYFKIPFLDLVYAKPKRTQDVIVHQINFTTKDDKQITASAAAFFKISNIREYYSGYAEPFSIIDGIIKNQMNRYFLENNYKDFNQDEFEQAVLSHLQTIKNKGVQFEEFNLITFSNARTYRFITDHLYSQKDGNLDEVVY